MSKISATTYQTYTPAKAEFFMPLVNVIKSATTRQVSQGKIFTRLEEK